MTKIPPDVWPVSTRHETGCTYEIFDEPSLGYQCGCYTSTELRELDAYAADSGIELVGCIQTLALWIKSPAGNILMACTTLETDFWSARSKPTPWWVIRGAACQEPPAKPEA